MSYIKIAFILIYFGNLQSVKFLFITLSIYLERCQVILGHLEQQNDFTGTTDTIIQYTIIYTQRKLPLLLFLMRCYEKIFQCVLKMIKAIGAVQQRKQTFKLSGCSAYNAELGLFNQSNSMISSQRFCCLISSYEHVELNNRRTDKLLRIQIIRDGNVTILLIFIFVVVVICIVVVWLLFVYIVVVSFENELDFYSCLVSWSIVYLLICMCKKRVETCICHLLRNGKLPYCKD